MDVSTATAQASITCMVEELDCLIYPEDPSGASHPVRVNHWPISSASAKAVENQVSVFVHSLDVDRVGRASKTLHLTWDWK
jgi:hypothetical protein